MSDAPHNPPRSGRQSLLKYPTSACGAEAQPSPHRNRTGPFFEDWRQTIPFHLKKPVLIPGKSPLQAIMPPPESMYCPQFRKPRANGQHALSPPRPPLLPQKLYNRYSAIALSGRKSVPATAPVNSPQSLPAGD